MVDQLATMSNIIFKLDKVLYRFLQRVHFRDIKLKTTLNFTFKIATHFVSGYFWICTKQMLF